MTSKRYASVFLIGLLHGGMTCLTGQSEELPCPPITVVASKDCLGFPDGWSWSVSVNASGNAALTVGSRIVTNFVVTREQITTLSRALDAENFFGLKDEYGELVFDANTDVLTVVRGHQAKTVRIHSLHRWLESHDSALMEPARAVRIFSIIRNWFGTPSLDGLPVTDDRPYLKRILDAAEKARPAQQAGGTLRR